MSFGIVGVHGPDAGVKSLKAVSAYDFRKEYPVVITLNPDPEAHRDACFNVYGFRGSYDLKLIHNFTELDINELVKDKSTWAIARVYNKRDLGPFAYGSKIGIFDGIAIVGNGRITNSEDVVHDMEERGVFLTIKRPYGEILAHKTTESDKNGVIDVIHEAQDGLEGGYSFLMLSRHGLAAVTDPHKHMPLCMGRIGETHVFSSDTDGLEALGAEYEMDIKPTVTFLSSDGEIIRDNYVPELYRHCLRQATFVSSEHSRIFEHNLNVARFRRRCGNTLYERYGDLIESLDMIAPMNSSALMAAQGINEKMNKPISGYVAKRSTVGEIGLRKELSGVGSKTSKYKAVESGVRGKRIGLVALTLSGESEMGFADDAMKKGAKEIYLFEPGPLIGKGCRYRGFWKESTSFEGDEDSVKEQLLERINEGNGIVKGIYPLDIKTTLELTDYPDRYCTECFCGGEDYLYIGDV